MVYDCFQFFNELDILKLRMHVLNDVVDKFVISEATVTFSGEKKDGMLIVLHGVIRVYMVSGIGREVTILIMRPGDVFNILTADCARPGDIMPQLQAMSDAAVAYIRRAELSRLAYGCPSRSAPRLSHA